MAHVFKMNDEEWYAAETEEEAIRTMAADQGWDLAVAEGLHSVDEGVEGMRRVLEIQSGYPKVLSDEDLLKSTARKEVSFECGCDLTFRDRLDELVADGSTPCSFAGPSCFGDYVAF